jgi:hemolysin D
MDRPDSFSFVPASPLEPTPQDPNPPSLGSQDSHKIRILIVDDQNFVRKMLQYSLESQLDLEVVGTAHSGQDALEQIEQLRPNIALVDIEMPGMNGLIITRTISEQYAQTKVLVLSSHDDDSYIRDALQAGAKGYLLKNTPPEELAHAIRFVQRGYLQLGPGLFEKLEEYPYALQSPPPSEKPVPIQSPIPLSGDAGHGAIATPKTTAIETQPLDLDWSAATHDTLNTLPKLWSRGLLYLTLVFTAILLPWAAFSQVDEVGTAQGRLEPKGNTIRLDAPVAGTVETISVREGQPVQKGQPLMALQSDIVNADLQQAQVKLEGLLNRKTQLMAIKSQLESSFSTARQQVKAQAVSQQATIDKAQKQQNSLQDSVSLIQNLLEKDHVKIARLNALSQQGAIPRSQVEDAERIMIQNSQQLQKTQTDIQQAQAEVQKQQSEYQRIMRDGELSLSDKTKQVKELQSQIIDAQSEAGQTQNLIKSLQYQRQQRVLYSPANGTLFQLLIQQPGAVVQPGQAIAQIAPKTARLVFRAQMDNRETGFLRVGLPAKLKFDAYPFQDYGLIPGKVNWISPTSDPSPSADAASVVPSPSAPKSNRFTVEIELAQTTIQAKGKAIALKAGQTATAEIIIRQRRVLDLFLDPFRKLKQGGLQL